MPVPTLDTTVPAAKFPRSWGRHLVAAALVLGTTPAAMALVMVNVQVQNLAAANSVSFAPLHIGFHSGIFDAFNVGQVAGAAIVSVAEGGAGGAWLSAFAVADPTATRGTVGGLLTPGATASMSYLVNPLLNPYFSFAAMVVPSNDFFIGNDSPTRFRLFDAAGLPQIAQIGQKASQIWDAGSEVFDPAAAAFVGNNSLRADQNSVVAFNFAELAAFNGLTTGAGYVFNSALTAGSDVYRIRFTVSAVPEPQSLLLMLAGLAGVAGLVRRRRETAADFTAA